MKRKCEHGKHRDQEGGNFEFCAPCFKANHEKYRGPKREYCDCPECKEWKDEQRNKGGKDG